jgi:hypothetical protein
VKVIKGGKREKRRNRRNRRWDFGGAMALWFIGVGGFS